MIGTLREVVVVVLLLLVLSLEMGRSWWGMAIACDRKWCSFCLALLACVIVWWSNVGDCRKTVSVSDKDDSCNCREADSGVLHKRITQPLKRSSADDSEHHPILTQPCLLRTRDLLSRMRRCAGMLLLFIRRLRLRGISILVREEEKEARCMHWK